MDEQTVLTLLAHICRWMQPGFTFPLGVEKKTNNGKITHCIAKKNLWGAIFKEYLVCIDPEKKDSVLVNSRYVLLPQMVGEAVSDFFTNDKKSREGLLVISTEPENM